MSNKKTLIKGTFILTVAGLLSRVLGFYNRIFLSRFIGAKEVGIYQLIFPIYGLCISISSQGIQTAISKMTAAYSTHNNPRTLKRLLGMGIALSLSLSVFISSLLFIFSDLISVYILRDNNCGICLKIAAISIPFAAIKSCIIGYDLGLKKSFLSASCQLVEQVLRVGSIYALSITYFIDRPAYASIAVAGMTFGDIISCLYLVICFSLRKKPKANNTLAPIRKRVIGVRLIKDSFLLTSNRIVLTLLQSLEAILIPAMLVYYYNSRDTSLEIYGILTGMALPFIFFPSAITNSLSVMLMPTISSAKEARNMNSIQKTVLTGIQTSLLIGILSTFLFLFYGHQLGTYVFHNESAGQMIFMLACLCPLIYLLTTLSSIQNGLGKVNRTLLHNVIGVAIRILFIVFALPKVGIKGYFWGELISDILVVCLDMESIYAEVPFTFDTIEYLLKPCLLGLISGGITLLFRFQTATLFTTLLQCMIFACIFGAGAVLFLLPLRPKRTK